MKVAIVESLEIISVLLLKKLDCIGPRYCLIQVPPLAGHIFDLERFDNKNMEQFLRCKRCNATCLVRINHIVF